MTFEFNTSLVEKYHNSSQKARILTEDWLGRNMYCPICGASTLAQFEANRPVADFFCKYCNAEYELKSKERAVNGIGNKIVDGEYNKMIERISAFNNPNFFFLTHYNYRVQNLVFIPNYFFVPEIIEKRKPLSNNARRAGWTGCNINLTSIPQHGKIYIVKNSIEINHNLVMESYKKIEALKTNSLEHRGWLIDVLNCVDKLSEEFTLNEMYSFTNLLQLKHPENNFVQPKIRQQLQILRDKGFIKFTKRGHYKKIK